MKTAGPLLFLLSCFTCFAQSFDVASIRPSNQARTNDVHFDTTPTTLTVRSASLRSIVRWAYDMPPFQFDGPAWMDSAGFDVMAKSSSPCNDEALRLMLRTLLAQRFGLKVHTEQREMQVYQLSLAKGGPKIHESTTEGPVEFTNGGKGILLAYRASIADFASKVSEPLNRPVIDVTGLKGRYDIRIDATAYMMDAAGNGGNGMDVEGLLFNAIQSQLGVKLDSRKTSVDILVVDHAEKTPTEN